MESSPIVPQSGPIRPRLRQSPPLVPPVSQDTSAGGGEGDLWLPELPCDLPSEVSRGASARFTEDIVDAYNAMRTLQALLS